MDSNCVRFYIRTKRELWQSKHQNQQLFMTCKVSATHPRDLSCCPEAFDPILNLEHMLEKSNLPEYAGLLQCRYAQDLARDIEQLLQECAKAKTAQFRDDPATWDTHLKMMTNMMTFLEQAVAGLKRNNEFELAAQLDKGREELQGIRKDAVNAQRFCNPQHIMKVFINN